MNKKLKLEFEFDENKANNMSANDRVILENNMINNAVTQINEGFTSGELYYTQDANKDEELIVNWRLEGSLLTNN